MCHPTTAGHPKCICFLMKAGNCLIETRLLVFLVWKENEHTSPQVSFIHFTISLNVCYNYNKDDDDYCIYKINEVQKDLWC